MPAVAVAYLQVRPRVVVRADGIEVRNLRTYRLAWYEVRRIGFEAQAPFRSKAARRAATKGPVEGDPEIRGVVVRPARGAPIPVDALVQGRFAKFFLGRSPIEGVAETLAEALHAAQRRQDPVAVARAARRRVRWLAAAFGSAIPGVLIGTLAVLRVHAA